MIMILPEDAGEKKGKTMPTNIEDADERKGEKNNHAIELPAFSYDLLEKLKQQRSIVFLLQYHDHYVVVRMEIRGDF